MMVNGIRLACLCAAHVHYYACVCAYASVSVYEEWGICVQTCEMIQLMSSTFSTADTSDEIGGRSLSS